MDYVDEKTKITFHLNNYQLLQCVITRNLFIFSEYFIDTYLKLLLSEIFIFPTNFTQIGTTNQ